MDFRKNLRLPPVMQNSEGNERRVGVEGVGFE
jgi:hypothetical protein